MIIIFRSKTDLLDEILGARETIVQNLTVHERIGSNTNTAGGRSGSTLGTIVCDLTLQL